jgi:UDP-N-acetylglucosamine 4-epimerase
VKERSFVKKTTISIHLHQKIQNKTVLVTGAAGFIGSNLVEDLLQNGNKVIGLDNFSTGFRSHIDLFEGNNNFTFIEGDIRNFNTCQFATKNVDIILHHAALGSVPRSINDPINTNSVNVDGFLNMLVAARDNKVKRFIYAASSSTYGDSKELPKIEENIGKPLSPYAVTKYVNELYAHVFRLNYGLEIIGLRYFNVFGRRQSPTGAYAAAIPKFIDQFLKLESPTINGDGSASRDFTYIDNVIQINNLAGTTTNQDAVGEVFNVAAGKRCELNTLIQVLQTELSKFNPEIAKVKVIYGPERQGDVKHSLASIEKAQQLLGYSPTDDFSSGIKKALNYYLRQFELKKLS